MESMLEILHKILKESNLETISKADLRQKYLEKAGLIKLPKEDKELFSSAVNTAYIDYINLNGTKIVPDNKETEKNSDNEMQENGEDWKLTFDSSSDDEITPANIKESDIADQFTTKENDIKMEFCSDSDEKSLAAYKIDVKKKSSNGSKKGGKRALSSSSEDESIENKPSKKKIVPKNGRRSSKSKAELNKKKVISRSIKSKNYSKRAKVESSDSEDEPLGELQKKSSSICESTNSVTKSDELEDKSLLKYSNTHTRITIDSEDEPIMTLFKKNNSINDSKKNSSDSEDEPLSKLNNKKTGNFENPVKECIKKNCDSDVNENILDQKNDRPFDKQERYLLSDSSEDAPLSKIKQNSGNDEDSEDEPLSKLNKKETGNDSEMESIKKTSDSDDGNLSKEKKEKSFNEPEKSPLSDSSEVESVKKPINKTENSSNSDDEPLEKIVKGKVKHSLKKPKKNSKVQAVTKKTKRGYIDSDDDISDKEKDKSSDGQKNSLLSDSNEDEPLSKIVKGKADSEDEPLEKIVKGKVKHSLEKPKSNRKSKDKAVNKTKRRYIDSDDEPSDKEKEKSSDGLKNALLSDSSEDEPLLKIVKKESDSEDEPLQKIVKGKKKHSLGKSKTNSKSKDQAVNKKTKNRSNDSDHVADKEKEKSSDAEKYSPLSESDDDKSLSKILTGESDSEGEPIKKLNNKTYNSSDSEGEPLKKIVKGKAKRSLKKPKTNSKMKDQAVNKKTKKKYIDSDDDISDEEEKSDLQKNSPLSESSEDEPLSNITIKKPKIASDSEDEPLTKLSSKKPGKERKSSESGSSSYADENKEHSSKKSKPHNKKEPKASQKQEKKRPSASENKIEHLKKYVRVAGIRIQNYNKLFENCKTMKAKCEKLLSLLEKEGLKGRPTLEKCKKLRNEIETKREIAELDMSNILKEKGGRSMRSVCSDTTNYNPEEKNSTLIKKFSRLQGIVDSEESD